MPTRERFIQLLAANVILVILGALLGKGLGDLVWMVVFNVMALGGYLGFDRIFGPDERRARTRRSFFQRSETFDDSYFFGNSAIGVDLTRCRLSLLADFSDSLQAVEVNFADVAAWGTVLAPVPGKAPRVRVGGVSKRHMHLLNEGLVWIRQKVLATDCPVLWFRIKDQSPTVWVIRFDPSAEGIAALHHWVDLLKVGLSRQAATPSPKVALAAG